MATPEQYISNTTQSISMKQAEILSAIARCNADGTYLDKNQLREVLSYKPNRDAVTFSLRYMLAQKRIEVAGREKRLSSSNQKKTMKTYRITILGRSFISAT